MWYREFIFNRNERTSEKKEEEISEQRNYYFQKIYNINDQLCNSFAPFSDLIESYATKHSEL